MDSDCLWRYMSLAKYVDLVCSRAIFFPKASLFPDETEGKWLAHAYLWGRKLHWEKTKANADALRGLLVRATGDPGRIVQEAALLYGTMTELEKKGVLGDVLADVLRVYPHKREEYLKGLVESWTKYHDSFNSEVMEYVDLSPFLRQTVKTQNSANGMKMPLKGGLSHGFVSTAVHEGVQVGGDSAAGDGGIASGGGTSV